MKNEGQIKSYYLTQASNIDNICLVRNNKLIILSKKRWLQDLWLLMINNHY